MNINPRPSVVRGVFVNLKLNPFQRSICSFGTLHNLNWELDAEEIFAVVVS